LSERDRDALGFLVEELFFDIIIFIIFQKYTAKQKIWLGGTAIPVPSQPQFQTLVGDNSFSKNYTNYDGNKLCMKIICFVDLQLCNSALKKC
jgi:hypothetical protein